MVGLGRRYKDSITEFEGVATSRTVYLNGCVRVGLEGKEKPGGDSVESDDVLAVILLHVHKDGTRIMLPLLRDRRGFAGSMWGEPYAEGEKAPPSQDPR